MLTYLPSDDFLFLQMFFFLVMFCLISCAPDLPVEVMAGSKRRPRNFNNSSVERNRNSVQESTSSTQPSKMPSVGLESNPNRITNAFLMSKFEKSLGASNRRYAM